MQTYFDKSLNVAGLKNPQNNFSVCTILQNSDDKRASITAYLGARYSRSADAMIDIAKEIAEAGTNAAERLEKIFHGYGHKSVGDMAQLFVCIENVPIFVSMHTFYVNPVYSGQERSTRYQDFSNPNYIKMPQNSDKKAIELYEQIIKYWISQYNKLKDKTYEALKSAYKVNTDNPKHASALRARSFDTVRYFIPLGVKTSFGIQMSARSFSEFISFFAASPLNTEQNIADMLLQLLGGKNQELLDKGYIPEADGLIRHTEPNHARNKSTQEVLTLIAKYIKPQKNKFNDLNKPITQLSDINVEHNVNIDILIHYALMLYPNADFEIDLKTAKKLGEKIGDILAKYHNHHTQIGNIAQTGAILIDGFADLGTLKDLNRHRSLERFIPIWEPNSKIQNEFERELDEMFALADYLDHPDLKNLKKEYEQAYIDGYKLIQEWLKQAPNLIDEQTFNEYTRYLVTHGHKTRYRMYGSLDDLQYTINLRTRNGGHISYRNLTYKWGIELAEKFPVFKGFMQNVTKVNPFDTFQFVDRS